MKKLLLTAAASGLLFSSSAFASEADTFFLKGAAGVANFSKIKDKATGYKLKGKASFVGEVGFGYNVLDNARVGLVYVFNANPEQKKTSGGVTIKHKPTINTFLVDGEVDLFDVSIAKVFVNAGVGLAQVKEKISYSYSLQGAVPYSASASVKNKNNIAYRIGFGVGTEVAPSASVNIQFSYSDYGTTKSFKDKTGAIGDVNQEISKTRYKAWEVKVGGRVDL